MIVWGGLWRQYHLKHVEGDTIPNTDSWVATSNLGAPAARRVTRAVWTGSEMIVWGGVQQWAYRF